MAGESLSFRILGFDVSASRTLDEVGDEADRTGRRIEALSGVGERTGNLLTGLFGNVGATIHDTANRSLDLGKSVGLTAAKLTTFAQVGATLGQTLVQAGAGAGVLAPALLTGAQAMGTLKLVTETATEELKALQPQLDGIKTAAADAFRPAFAEAVKTFGSNLPVVRDGVRDTARVFGELSVEAAGVFSGPAFRKDLADVMKVNTDATRNLGRAGISMAGAFWDVAVAAKDVWANFAGLTESGARQVAQWVEAKRESGELTAAIQRGATSIGDMVTSVWNFGAGVKSIFGAIAGDGVNVSATLLDISVKFRDWAESATVVNAVAGYFAGFRQAVSFAKDEVVELANQFTTGFKAGTVSEDATGLSLVFQTLGVRAGDVARLVRDELWPTFERVGGLVRDTLLPIVSQLSLIFSDTLNAAIAGVARIVRDDLVPVWESFAPILRDVILPAVSSLAAWMRDELFPAVERVAASVRDNLKPAFDTVYTAIMDNKEELKLLWTGLGEVASIILSVVEFAIKNNLKGALDAAGSAIGVVIEALGAFVRASLELASAVLGVAAEIIGGFRDIVDACLAMATGVVGVMAKLPGPLGAPWRSAEEAINGFRNTVNTDLGTAEGRVLAAQGRINGWLDGLHDKTITITVVEQTKKITEFQTYYSSIKPAARALGGPVSFGELYKVGERGTELFTPWTNGAIIDAATTAKMLNPSMSAGLASRPALSGDYGRGGGSTVNITVVNNIAGSVTTERELVEKIAPGVRDALVTRFAGSNGRRTGL